MSTDDTQARYRALEAQAEAEAYHMMKTHQLGDRECATCAARQDLTAVNRTVTGRLLEALGTLQDAAETYSALQDGATNPRLGIVQPITVAEGNALNAALDDARQALALVDEQLDRAGVAKEEKA